MTCVYTGAYVFFDEYGFSSPADIYVVGDCFVVRWNTAGMNYDKDKPREITHTVSIKHSFHREDIGVSVVPSCDLTPTEHARDMS